MTTTPVPGSAAALWADVPTGTSTGAGSGATGTRQHPADLRSADVVVVGAGVVGLSTAMLLVEAGLRPVVLERRTVGGRRLQPRDDLG